MLPFADDDTVLLVRQWRYPLGRATWEMPTGAMHPGETPEAAVQRELAEETGVEAGRLRRVTAFSTSKSVLDETANLYLCFDLRPAGSEAEPDPTELITVRPFPFDEALAMVLSGEIVDAMSIIALLWADRRRRLGPWP
jgi:ADP-ribose pyrophosphatase